jgi:hypothetical protein
MPKKYRIQSAIALLIGTALLVPVVSIAQPQTTSSVDEQDVDQVARQRCKQGKQGKQNYQRVGPVRKGYLAQGNKLVLPYNLTQERNYCFVAVGDEQAIDVDLELLDRNGRSLKPPVVDRTNDETAFVIFAPKPGGRYNAQVEMYECQAQQCEYAVGTYRRR